MRVSSGIGSSFALRPLQGQGKDPQLDMLHQVFQTGDAGGDSVQGLQAGVLQQVLQNVLTNQDGYAATGVASTNDGGQTQLQNQNPLELLMQLLGLLGQQNPALAMELLRALMGGQGGPSGGGLASMSGGGAAPSLGGAGGGVASFAGGAGTLGSGAANQQVQSLSNDLASRSPLFAQLNSLFPGPVSALDLPDPVGGDLRGLYNPNTNAVVLDSDNLGGNPLEVQKTLAEEVAHRAISQSTLQNNPGANVATQANEVIAKTYANLVVAEAQGIPLTPDVMDQAVNQAVADVALNYGGVPKGNYGAMLDSFLNVSQIGNEPLLRDKLIRAFQANGFAP